MKDFSINDSLIVHVVLRTRKMTCKEFLTLKKVQSQMFTMTDFSFLRLWFLQTISYFSVFGYLEFDFVYFLAQIQGICFYSNFCSSCHIAFSLFEEKEILYHLST